MLIVLVRHPEVQKNNEKIFVGQQDLLLSAAGEVQAERLSHHLKENFEFQRILSSPLTRCRETARRVSERFLIPFEVDDRLKEMHFGRWEGKDLEEIFRENREADLFYPPGGETLELFRRRVEQFFLELIGSGAEKPVLVITHAGVNKVILMKVLGLTREQFWDLPQDTAAVTEIYCANESEFQLGRFNDRGYLEGE